MPRPLPWKRNEPPLSRKRAPPSPAVGAQARQTSKRPRRHPASTVRTPSSSPPPLPPSSISPMRTGEDDAWIVVEDEFLSTAQTYTRHLHFAEYKRLQEQARKEQRNKTTTRTMDASTIQRKLDDLSAYMDVKDQKEDQAWNSDQDYEELFSIADRNLAGLMFGTTTSKARGKPTLPGLVGPPRSRTKAAAAAAAAAAAEVDKQDPPQKIQQVAKRRSKEVSSQPNTPLETTRLVLSATPNNDYASHQASSGRSYSRQARRRARRNKTPEPGGIEVIPTFL